ncbi:MAG: ABC transporter permease [Ilumatobacteraceae bacterium]
MRFGSSTGLVMGREIRQRIRSRAFTISTIALCIGVLGAGILSRALSGDDSPTEYDVAVVGTVSSGLDDAISQVAQRADIEVHLREVGTRAEADQLIRDGDIDAAIDTGKQELVSDDEAPDELAAVIDASWRAVQAQQAAVDAGLDQQQIDVILAPAPLRAVQLDGDDNAENIARGIGMAVAVVLFISINAFGGLVLSGVVEEKTTGVVEVLLGHVRAYQLLAGKVFGIGVVAMTQMTATILAGVVSLRISGRTVPSEVWVGLPTTVLWYVLGFVLYSTLFALAGSFVSRQEDAQSAAAPISLLFTAGYVAVFALGANPYSTVTRVVSVLPPFAPLLMPLRVAMGAASILEIVIAGVGLVLGTAAMLRVAGGVYGRTLLHRGSRLRWKQALRLQD